MPFAGTDKIDPQISPMVQRHGIPRSFFSGDVRMVDTFIEYDISTGGNVNYNVRWDTGPVGAGGGSLKHILPSFAIVASPNQPQWLLAGAPGNYAVRVERIIDLSGTLTTAFWDGAWRRMTSTFFPTLQAGVGREGDFVHYIVEVGPWPVDGTIIARAQYKITFI